MLLFSGTRSLSLPRAAQIIDSAHKQNIPVTELQGKWLYIVETTSALSAESLQQLEQLLQASLSSQVKQDALVVTPRVGTCSAWSTKATQLAHIVGLDMIQRIEYAHCYTSDAPLDTIAPLLHDKMTQSVFFGEVGDLFVKQVEQQVSHIPMLTKGKQMLEEINSALGLALSDDEIVYLYDLFQALQRNPTDAELMMFAQVNSEHCRHKVFNAKWTVDGKEHSKSLFAMVRNTHACTSSKALVAYDDNAAVIAGGEGYSWRVCSGKYDSIQRTVHNQIKVETHNHPTAISPFPGAATGAGGEIRDEAATGRGSKPKVGLVGYSVSYLDLPDSFMADRQIGTPSNIASALQIMLEAPIGAARYNNEFGRPVINGYFRSWQQQIDDELWRGYHKPIMLAGGLGNIDGALLTKCAFPSGSYLIVLGGGAQLIGLGGGASSSQTSGTQSEALDYASVQRGNPEMERRVQEVIDQCVWLDEANPILSIHDVGAGGLSNALPELIHDAGAGGRINLREILVDEYGMSPAEIWCNESQERYVLAISESHLQSFLAICTRERCPVCVVGQSNDSQQLELVDALFDNDIVNLPLTALLADTPKMHRVVERVSIEHRVTNVAVNDIEKLALDVLEHPTVADKSFLITIGDRSVGGLVAQDQMVGPLQIPVADCGVSLRDYQQYIGEAMAIGERTPVAVHNASASARLAVAEALTNILSADIRHLSDIKLSANWMAAIDYAQDSADLFDMVHAIGMELCPQLDVSIPVGKDSMSMRLHWQDNDTQKQVVSPVSLVVSAFSAVADVRKTVTPQLCTTTESDLWLIDLGGSKNRLGGSIFAEITEQQMANDCPDLDSPQALITLHEAIKQLRSKDMLWAYHDRSDGGLWACLVEMALASNIGLSIDLCAQSAAQALFSEEIGVVIQTPYAKRLEVEQYLAGCDTCRIGSLQTTAQIDVKVNNSPCLSLSLSALRRAWSKVSYQMRALRDNSICSEQEYDSLCAIASDTSEQGLRAALTFQIDEPPAIMYSKPKVAILRDQGVNGHHEMAAAYTRAGFEAWDVSMQDLLDGRRRLSDFQVLAACGGFSYGDVLGAGQGWAKTILFNTGLRDQFAGFFARADTLSFGACNGCQMLAALKDIIPETAHWPQFVDNLSEQYEARLALVQLDGSQSVLTQSMQHSVLPVPVAHGEGRAVFDSNADYDKACEKGLILMRYVDYKHQISTVYPFNPNGSHEGVAGVCSADGRVSICMPHPERVFRSVQLSWSDAAWQEQSPWMQLFHNAYKALS